MGISYKRYTTQSILSIDVLEDKSSFLTNPSTQNALCSSCSQYIKKLCSLQYISLQQQIHSKNLWFIPAATPRDVNILSKKFTALAAWKCT